VPGELGSSDGWECLADRNGTRIAVGWDTLAGSERVGVAEGMKPVKEQTSGERSLPVG